MNGMTATDFRDFKERAQPEEVKNFIHEQCIHRVKLLLY